MFKPNVVTSGLLMTGNKIKVVKKKKNSKETSAAPVSNTMFAAPEKLSYNDPFAVKQRKDDLINKRLEDKKATDQRKANPMTDRELGKKVKDAEKFHKKAGNNRKKATGSAVDRLNYNTGGLTAAREKATKKEEKKGCGLGSPNGKYTGNVCKPPGGYYKNVNKKVQKRSEKKNPGLKKSPKDE